MKIRSEWLTCSAGSLSTSLSRLMVNTPIV